MMHSDKLLIFVPEITSRVKFTFEFIFRTILGVELVFTTSPDEFLQSNLPKINYSPASLSSGLFLKAHPILFEKNIKNQEIVEVDYQQHRLFFPSSEDSFLPFDPFAFSFYLLTRYEEYLSEITDEHERFADSENILVRNQLNHKPIVDRMAYWVAEKLSTQFQEFKIQKRNFKFLTTIDIDNAWAFKNKNFGIWLGSSLKAAAHGKWKELKLRLLVSFGLKNDPYDTYPYILDTYREHLNHLRFFFLIGDRNQYDKNISHKNKNFRQLISHLASVCTVGIHPSYSSNHKPWQFEKEKKRLEKIIHQPVTQSRQHYLKLRFPNTYHSLLKSGITDDFTMGFASLCGFRAGTCTTFPFFDLSHNRRTELMIHPFQVMDVTLKDYQLLKPEEAWQLIEKLMIEVKEVNGTFISIWHNESLAKADSGLDWRQVFEQTLATGLKFEHES